MAEPSFTHSEPTRIESGKSSPSRRILVVDPQPEVRTAIERAAAQQDVTVLTAGNAADARRLLAKYSVALALIEPDLPDGSGIALANQIRQNARLTQLIVISQRPSIEQAVQAVRAGASDLMLKPASQREWGERIGQALERYQHEARQARRIKRLRRVCRKLNAAHDEVTQQVDILCQDLVSAYQELAEQMQQVAQTSEFATLMRQDLDLESMLRKTLEFLLEKAGPTNAAVFLPTTHDEYTLGGYVNLDSSKEAASLLLDHLADVLAPKLGQCDEPVRITDNETMAKWLGHDTTFLQDAHALAFTCRHEDEALAVVVLFREAATPYDELLAATCAAIAPQLGKALAKAIRVHHRAMDSFAA